MRWALAAIALVSMLGTAEAQVRHRRPYSGGYILGYGFDNDGGRGGCVDYACGGACYDGHTGEDFWVPYGGEVLAGQEGVVIATYNGCANYGYRNNPCGGYCGNHVTIRHADGTRSRYCHMQLNSVRVSNGQRVGCGQLLGVVGSSGSSTGPHLHFAYETSGGGRQEAFAGGCGRSSTRWVEQRGYREAPGTSCGECSPGETRGCGSDVGACRRGVQSCSGGSWGGCAGEIPPRAEECNGVDDNCDGTVDDFERSCGSDVGECVAGRERCHAGAWSECAGSVPPVPERCDRLDNDCDAVADEDDVCEIEEIILQGPDVGEALTDLDGDGDADLCACGEHAVECYLASGHGFEHQVVGPGVETARMSEPSRYSTLRLGDVDGDGLSDVCLRDADGVRCWVSEGDGFGDELVGPALSNDEGFDEAPYYTTIRLADVDGDGRADLCARWVDGLRCYFASGHGFEESTQLPDLSDAAGFDAVERYGTLRFGDIDGDGRADVCARRADGMMCWRSEGRGFGDAVVGPAWDDAAGFDALSRWSTIRLADVDGDGRADLCARTRDGFECHPATGRGFGDPYVGPALRSEDGWDDPSQFSTLRMGDVDGDGRVDLCGRDRAGTACWLFTGRGFDRRVDGPMLSDDAGWSAPEQFRTIRLADVDGDGRADLCARDDTGYRCWTSGGTDFPFEIGGPSWGEGWEAPHRYATIRMGGGEGAVPGSTPTPSGGMDAGCGCVVGGPSHTPWFLSALVWIVARRRRRRESSCSLDEALR